MGDIRTSEGTRVVGDNECKAESSANEESAATDDYYNHNGVQDDEAFAQHNYEEDDERGIPNSAVGEHLPDRELADAGSDDEHETGIKLSEKDEHRLLGAFLLASDGGLEGESGRRGLGSRGGEEPHLSTFGPTCLQKFTTIAASLGLKTTREKLREDFEMVVNTNGLVRNSSEDPWLGAHDTSRPVLGFTYKIFRRYYLAKIQGELLEANIRQAWEDLHHGTGGKLIRPGRLYIAAPTATDEMPAGGREGYQQQQQQQEQEQRHSDSGNTSGRGTPYVARKELQKILTTHGQALTDEEADQLLRECRPDEQGRIVYEGYRRMLLDPSL